MTENKDAEIKQAIKSNRTMNLFRIGLDNINYMICEHAFSIGYKASKPQSPWTPIDDPIVETWKDGRRVLIGDIDGYFYSATWSTQNYVDGTSHSYWSHSRCGWFSDGDGGDDNIYKFAMLPPQLPESDK